MLCETVAINGWFLTQTVVGIQRFARETLAALDSQAGSERLVLVVPRGTVDIPALTNIRVVRLGKKLPLLWEQLVFPCYAILHRMQTLNFCNVVPLASPGIVCIHDIFYRTHWREFTGTPRGLFSMLWHRIQYCWAAILAKGILTVSEYSAAEIGKCYHVDRSRLAVVYNGWDHMKRVQGDDRVFDRLAGLRKGHYFLSVGSMADYKNLQWIVASARKHPQDTYVIVGKSMPSSAFSAVDGSDLPNVKLTGFLSDSEIKSLIANCEAFIHPSKREGFGIPPLEALGLGCVVIVSRATCLPEIFGNAVGYIDDPCDYANADPREIIGRAHFTPSDQVLERFVWRKTAERVAVALSRWLNKDKGEN